MFKKILIANRGEIAVRIIRACKEMGIETVAIYSKADEKALHKQLATEAICVGEAPSSESYLNVEAILSAACLTGCDAIHPGFGFLSENAQFASMVQKCGLVFIGPNPQVIEKMGNKSAAIMMMKEAGVPIVPGSYAPVELEEGREIAKKIGYPILIKASAGGGGKGIRLVETDADFADAYQEAKEEAKKFFANDELYIEKFIINPKHVEVQVMCDHFGNAIHLFERNCSLQRRKQKMLEEAPCQSISDELKAKLYDSAILACKSVGYDSVGTIEFLIDKNENYYFIEMNTRIQVEHSITEAITNVDIVKNMIKIAFNLPLRYKQEDIKLLGYAIECRINAEDIKNDFVPSPGKIKFMNLPGGNGIRIDGAAYSGYQLPPYYDSNILKIIAFAKTRLECIRKMRAALEELIIDGIHTTIDFHYMILHHPTFILGYYDTGFVDMFLKELKENARFIH
ncbi:MAG: acetyl-CoA carboxylase biotin carboxylase subunit [Anaeroplasmataceae bacterium]|nr:acetyl-CoA carboxylase biotin carboxylase subunit [Anaeroplasmataceae bacterium]